MIVAVLGLIASGVLASAYFLPQALTYLPQTTAHITNLVAPAITAITPYAAQAISYINSFNLINLTLSSELVAKLALIAVGLLPLLTYITVKTLIITVKTLESGSTQSSISLKLLVVAVAF